jgi:diacylglycerol kinase (ATP)
VRRLVFVVNPASCSRNGRWLQARLRTLHPGEHLLCLGQADLSSIATRLGGSDTALVACGGDGTAAAVLEVAWRVHQAQPGQAPLPVGVIPLGTGNDLARYLGWAQPVSTVRALDRLLARLERGASRPIDRWVLRGPVRGVRGAQPPVATANSPAEPIIEPLVLATPGCDRPWFNYCSLGADARIALHFHDFRQRHPAWFRARWANRLAYAALGAQEPGGGLMAVMGRARPFPRGLPAWASSLVMTSIPSYAGGVRLPAGVRADDGRLEAFGLPCGLSLGLVVAGLRRPCCVGPFNQLELDLPRPLPMQVDGEPFVAAGGRYLVSRQGQARVVVVDRD